LGGIRNKSARLNTETSAGKRNGKRGVENIIERIGRKRFATKELMWEPGCTTIVGKDQSWRPRQTL